MPATGTATMEPAASATLPELLVAVAVTLAQSGSISDTRTAEPASGVGARPGVGSMPRMLSGRPDSAASTHPYLQQVAHVHVRPEDERATPGTHS